MTTLQHDLIAELPAGYQARPAALTDAPAVVAMLNLASRALLGVDHHTVADMESDWQTPGLDLAGDTRVVLAPSGEVAGYVNLWDTPPHVQYEQWGCVHPTYVGQGIGSYLAAWVEDQARARLPQAPRGARVTLEGEANNLDTRAQRLLLDCGYRHVRSNLRMVIDLDANTPPGAAQWPDGVSVRSFVPGQDDRVALRTIRAAFRDHWGSVERPFEDHLRQWTHFWQTDPDFDPSLWFLALARGEVIGTAFTRRGIPSDPGMGWIFSLGVLRPWRRRGMAGALLQHCFAELWQRGRRKVGLGVDAENLTNALHLYEKAGMRPDPTQAYQVWQKELRPGVDLSNRG